MPTIALTSSAPAPLAASVPPVPDVVIVTGATTSGDVYPFICGKCEVVTMHDRVAQCWQCSVCGELMEIFTIEKFDWNIR